MLRLRYNHAIPRRNIDMTRVIFRRSKIQELETILWSIKNREVIEKFSDVITYPKLPRLLRQLITEDKKTFEGSRSPTRRYLNTTGQFELNGKIKNEAIRQWRKIEEEFFQKISALGLKPRRQYICYLTQYGGGGSFKPPNLIWVRLNPHCKSDRRHFNYTVAHEIIHLQLKRRLKNKSQSSKEKAVDETIIKTGLFQ